MGSCSWARTQSGCPSAKRSGSSLGTAIPPSICTIGMSAFATAGLKRFGRSARGAPAFESRFYSRVSQHNGCLDLSLRDAPVGSEQLGLARGRDGLEAVALIEADGPGGGGPGADQHLPFAQPPQMRKQRAPDAASLVFRQDVSVTDQIDLLHGLKSHDADKLALHFIAPEHDSAGDFFVELLPRHVGLVPAVSRNDAAVSFRGSVDDCENEIALVVATKADV